MVLETIVSKILEKHLGKYVLGLKKENLKIAVSNGIFFLSFFSLISFSLILQSKKVPCSWRTWR